MKYSLEEVSQAFAVAQQNAYTKYHTDKEVLFYVFMAGMIFQKTGEKPKSVLDDPEELERIHKKLYEKKNEKV